MHSLTSIKQKIFSEENFKALALCGMCAVALSVTPEAFAGDTGTEFQATYDKMVGMISGFGGKMIAGISLATALIGSVLRFNPYIVFGALGTGITASVGTSIIDATVTALI